MNSLLPDIQKRFSTKADATKKTILTQQELLGGGTAAHVGEVPNARNLVLITFTSHRRENTDLLACVALPQVIELRGL